MARSEISLSPASASKCSRVTSATGARDFSIRDLRNGNVIHNVSLASARKLWSYAINQYLTNPVDAEQGDLERRHGSVAGSTPGEEAAL